MKGLVKAFVPIPNLQHPNNNHHHHPSATHLNRAEPALLKRTAARALTGFSFECLLAFLQLFVYFLRRFKTQIRDILVENMFSSSMEPESLDSESRITKQMKLWRQRFWDALKKMSFFIRIIKIELQSVTWRTQTKHCLFSFFFPSIFLFPFYVSFSSCYYNMNCKFIETRYFSV